MTMEPQLPYLPQDVIQEILSRLPVKSLVKFKTVSKFWHHLIFNSFFQKQYLKQSLHHNRKFIMFLHPYNRDSLSYEASHDKSIQVEDPRVDVLASCNGLFCITTNNGEGEGQDNGDLFLWNPSMGSCKKIPSLKVEFPPDGSCTSAMAYLGLGYDSSLDDYKLVRVSMFHSEDFQTEVHIYSRNSDSWKRIGEFPYEFPSRHSGVSVCGRVHWILCMRDENEGQCYKIATLNVAEEKYEIMELPEGDKTGWQIRMGSLDENLVVFSLCDDLSFDIWILKEYGKAESWVKMKVPKECIVDWYHFEPLCLLNPGKILLRVGTYKCVSFDIKDKRCSDVYLPDMPESKLITFVQSLESPNLHSLNSMLPIQLDHLPYYMEIN